MKLPKQIYSLKDLKDVLASIPDEDLDRFGIGLNLESDGEVAILVMDEDDMDLFDKHKKQYKLLDGYLENIKDAHEEFFEQENDFEGDDPFITSDRKGKKK